MRSFWSVSRLLKSTICFLDPLPNPHRSPLAQSVIVHRVRKALAEPVPGASQRTIDNMGSEGSGWRSLEAAATRRRWEGFREPHLVALRLELRKQAVHELELPALRHTKAH